MMQQRMCWGTPAAAKYMQIPREANAKLPCLSRLLSNASEGIVHLDRRLRSLRTEAASL